MPNLTPSAVRQQIRAGTPEAVRPGAKRLAAEIASKAPIAVRLAKAAVNKAYELALREGLEFERQSFYTLFATEDQKEGMRAFVEKRPAQYQGR